MRTSSETMVSKTAQDNSYVLAQLCNYQCVLNINKDNTEAGFITAKTCIATLGTCLMTNINGIGENMYQNIDEIRLELSSTRTNIPPIINKIVNKLFIKSDETPERLAGLL